MVSVIGTPKIITGMITVMKVAFFNPFNEKIEIINPINSEPVSPKYIRAGKKLYGKNPKQAATNAKIIIDTYTLPTFKKKNPVIPIVVRAITATPVANPSKPSIKLTALVIARIQIQVIGKLNQPSPNVPINGSDTLLI